MTFLQPIQKEWVLQPPLIPFTDRFQSANAYIELNPALFYDDAKGEWLVLVRGVNYRKFYNNSFTQYEIPSRSVYWLGRGSHISNLSFQQLTWNYNRPTYNTLWFGVEDIRFLSANRILATIPELSPKGQPMMFTASLDIDKAFLYNFIAQEPSKNPEKNWMPFLDPEISGCWPKVPRVLYSVSPNIEIRTLDPSGTLWHSFPSFALLEGYHGSTNGICVKDNTYLFLIHKNQNNRTEHRWFEINMDTFEVRCSSPFTFFRHSYIEFPCSLVQKENTLFVSTGINDCKAIIVEIDIDTISLDSL